jgi:dCMP deaminase
MNKWDERFIDLAVIISTWSYCKKLQVGAIIVNNNRIISTGFNGTPQGFKNVCECDNVTLPYVIHAEENSILQCLRNGIVIPDNSTIYCTHFPCYNCAKIIINTGKITKLVYLNDYNNNESKTLLLKCDIDIIKYES